MKSSFRFFHSACSIMLAALLSTQPVAAQRTGSCVPAQADALLVPDATVGLPIEPPEPTFTLGFAQNYPNPFSETTTIRYSVPHPMHVRLRVYDVLGREVATLVNERQGSGVYEASFEANSLPGGIYFYRITLDHLRFTRRMALVR